MPQGEMPLAEALDLLTKRQTHEYTEWAHPEDASKDTPSATPTPIAPLMAEDDVCSWLADPYGARFFASLAQHVKKFDTAQ